MKDLTKISINGFPKILTNPYPVVVVPEASEYDAIFAAIARVPNENTSSVNVREMHGIEVFCKTYCAVLTRYPKEYGTCNVTRRFWSVSTPGLGSQNANSVSMRIKESLINKFVEPYHKGGVYGFSTSDVRIPFCFNPDYIGVFSNMREFYKSLKGIYTDL